MGLCFRITLLGDVLGRPVVIGYGHANNFRNPGRGLRVPTQWEEAYVEHYTLLCRIATGKFSVPADEAQALVQDVFIAYVTVAATITDIRAWLIAATCNASRNYWRAAARLTALPSDERRDDLAAAAVESQAMTRLALERVSGKHRDAVRLRYLEGCTMKEIAQRLGTTPKYADKLVRVGLRRIQEMHE